MSNVNSGRSAHGTAGAALEAYGVGKKHRRGWALKDCFFRLPAGRICGLVGPNGAERHP